MKYLCPHSFFFQFSILFHSFLALKMKQSWDGGFFLFSGYKIIKFTKEEMFEHETKTCQIYSFSAWIIGKGNETPISQFCLNPLNFVSPFTSRENEAKMSENSINWKKRAHPGYRVFNIYLAPPVSFLTPGGSNSVTGNSCLRPRWYDST